MSVQVLNRAGAPVPEALLRRAVRLALGRRHLSVAVAVLDGREMARLNWRHLRHRGATDALAFPPGDIAVCLPVARREARARGLPWEQELARYAVHACLHLLGYDDHRPADRRRMWKRQEAVLAAAGAMLDSRP